MIRTRICGRIRVVCNGVLRDDPLEFLRDLSIGVHDDGKKEIGQREEDLGGFSNQPLWLVLLEVSKEATWANVMLTEHAAFWSAKKNCVASQVQQPYKVIWLPEQHRLPCRHGCLNHISKDMPEHTYQDNKDDHVELELKLIFLSLVPGELSGYHLELCVHCCLNRPELNHFLFELQYFLLSR